MPEPNFPWNDGWDPENNVHVDKASLRGFKPYDRYPGCPDNSLCAPNQPCPMQFIAGEVLATTTIPPPNTTAEPTTGAPLTTTSATTTAIGTAASTTTLPFTTTSSFPLPTPAPTAGPKFYTVVQDFSVCICDTYKTKDGVVEQYQGKDCSQLVQEVEAQSVMTTDLMNSLRSLRSEF